MKRPHESVVDGSKASPAAPTPGSAALPKDLPALDRLLRQPAAAALVAEHGQRCVAGEGRTLLDTLRAQAL
ncbi:MAG TPA: L-seryl-tRNA(Sec) selenium transferase, partial [Rubrivivax sp.]|nr:L-seryl-tRNA(Sec) selenium transferase [Rubrivivax sp.]